MSKTKRWLIPVVVLSVMLGLAAPAMGGVDCEKRPHHPQCPGGSDPSDDYPTGGFMCDPADYPAGIEGGQTGDFSFTLGGSKAYACVDIDAAGPWQITVDGSRARSLMLIGRDSVSPGDACDVRNLRGEDEISGSNPVVLGMPAATINACGVEWAEWVSLDTPGLDPDGHCVDFDGAGRCLVTDMVDVAHPLVLQADMSGFRNASVTVEVDLP